MAEQDFRIPRELATYDFPNSLIEGIWNELATPYEPDERLDELTPGQRGLYSLQWVFSEVCNGGFDQCFDNSTGFLLPEAIEGAALFEAPDWFAALKEASRLLGSPFPRDRIERQGRLNALSEDDRQQLRDLDDRLYELDSAPETSFDAICRRYVEAHPGDFYLHDPSPEVVAQGLLDTARRAIDGPLGARNVELAETFLLEAQQISKDHSLRSIGSQVDSLLAQIPYLRI